MHEFSCCSHNNNQLDRLQGHEAFKTIEPHAFFSSEMGQLLLEDHRFDIFRENIQLKWEKEQSDKMIESLQNELKSMRAYCHELKTMVEKSEETSKLLATKMDKEQELKTQAKTLKITHDVLLKEHEQRLLLFRKDTRVIERVAQLPKFEVAPAKHPLDVLHSVTQQTLDKIKSTDVRLLNKRLKRIFDMTELSEMSNKMIMTLLDDLDRFHEQFDWVHTCPDINRRFFPLVELVCDMMKEMCTIKMTLNDLQADYVKRIKKASSPATTTNRHTIIILPEEKSTWLESFINTFWSLTS
ncbi:hypothetical protein G6F68_005268 [Rhizopus microsporus]|nr:hypothetical protein G6F69_004182 [Rhizopus microsporus]KAG1233862.1 hypothetical protein G6F67_003984 [Rhizopus microsporus]KAG1263259.1 hypothetical protein G6F68_005268 [Rhizopus microsporus]